MELKISDSFKHKVILGLLAFFLVTTAFLAATGSLNQVLESDNSATSAIEKVKASEADLEGRNFSGDEKDLDDAVGNMSDFSENSSSALENIGASMDNLKEDPQEAAEQLEEAQEKFQDAKQSLKDANKSLNNVNDTESELEDIDLTFNGALELEAELIKLSNAVEAKTTGLNPYITALESFGEGNANIEQNNYEEATEHYTQAINSFNQSASDLKQDKIESPDSYQETFDELICTASMLEDISKHYNEGSQAYINENQETGDQKFEEGDSEFGRCN